MKKKLSLTKLTILLLTIAPIMVESRFCPLIWVGEPELPAKFHQ